ncbi:hypothetical protein Sjap_014539 [Stephania japonica]|uniref:Disease resistance RPP13-like protein 4 n=1 Tax=Stephania japonica TaxID=461633 RepID=A0AAP0IJC5_9MAGN
MADAVVSVFLEKLLSALADQSSPVSDFTNQFELLRDELQYMLSFLSDAEKLKRRAGDATLRTTMANLRELIYQAEDILADCATTSRPRIISTLPLMDLQFRYKTGKRLMKLNERISDIKQRLLSYVGVIFAGQNSPGSFRHGGGGVGRFNSLYDHDQVVVGLEEDAEKIKEWLFSGNDPNGLLAIGVVGMGGLGKTTIARTVFDDRRVEDYYERRIWVSVSQPLNEERVMRMMDDVWSEDNSWWRRISSALPKGNGSSVMITTRIENVARNMGVAEGRIHRPSLLSEGNSWLLLRLIALAAENGECGDVELEKVGMEIVHKCKGFPLAIKAVGGILFYKTSSFFEWRRIADHFHEELAKNGDTVKASLQLSYDELPSHLKACLLCFSLYPEDCIINKKQLVHWWIGEGFIPMRNGELTIEEGEDCFSGLMNRCLVEAVERSYNGRVGTCKMHDMVRELVIRLAEENAFTSFSSGGVSSRRLGLITSDINFLDCIRNSKLRALVSTTDIGEVNEIVSAKARSYQKLRYLRALDLSKSIFHEDSWQSTFEWIGSLKHLNYLSFNSVHPLAHLPRSVENLKNLRILDASYCLNLEMLPSCITYLEKLMVLDVSNCGSLRYLPKGLGVLSNLQALTGFRPSKLNESRGCRISELRKLTRLRTLGLRLIEEKLNKLSPPQKLQELCLEFFPSNTSPAWLNPSSLPLLQYLSISSGNLAKMNECFWGDGRKSWKVEGLMLNSLLDLAMEWEDVQLAMPCLRSMNISWCPRLENFPVEEVGFRGGMWKKEQRR